MRGLKRYQEASPGLNYTPIRVMELDGHQVGWVSYRERKGEFRGQELMCECDFKFELEAGHMVTSSDKHHCKYKKVAQELRALEVHEELDKDPELGNRLLRGGGLHIFNPELMPKLVLKLLEKVEAGEWIGQRDGTLYVQQVAKILKVPESVIHKLVRVMYREKLIGLSGSLIEPYHERYEPRDDDDHDLVDNSPPEAEALPGKLTFFSETGTEGGYWAFQDARYIKLEKPEYPKLGAGFTVFDSFNPTRKGITLKPLDQTQVEWEDGELETRESQSLLMERWSYEGLHTLKTGDYLTIFDPEGGKAFEGYIRLRHYPSFTEAAGGMWIHADQRGVPRDEWLRFFTGGYPARLILAKQKKS